MGLIPEGKYVSLKNEYESLKDLLRKTIVIIENGDEEQNKNNIVAQLRYILND